MAYKEADSCRDKAKADEPIFTLRAQDRLAPMLVEAWAAFAEEHGAPTAKVQEARACARDMRAWADTNGAKWPD